MVLNLTTAQVQLLYMAARDWDGWVEERRTSLSFEEFGDLGAVARVLREAITSA